LLIRQHVYRCKTVKSAKPSLIFGPYGLSASTKKDELSIESISCR
jgi:hypothetical protein